MAVEIHQVDAFAAEPFRGNPAAVCLLDGAADESWMEQVAREMNLSETAFVWSGDDTFELRWFTPTGEVPLCGHATLATAHVLWETGRATGPIRFRTRSGLLHADRRGTDVEIDLPAQPVTPAELPDGIRVGLGAEIRFVGRTPDRGLDDVDYLIELGSDDSVRSLVPPLERMRTERGGFIVTAAAETAGLDYVCRYFAPSWGIDEDPVTGAAHCALVPFWSERMGKTDLVGLQASSRTGTVRAKLRDDRVLLAGGAITVLRGELLAG